MILKSNYATVNLNIVLGVGLVFGNVCSTVGIRKDSKNITCFAYYVLFCVNKCLNVMVMKSRPAWGFYTGREPARTSWNT